MMDRRNFITESGMKLGILAIGPGLLLSTSCNSNGKTAFNESFSLSDVHLINELGNVMIPPTDTPSAKTAQVGEFIALIVQDCYSEKYKVKFQQQLVEVDKFSRQTYGRIFLDCTDKERTELVSLMENDHDGYNAVKNLIVSAYLSSEIGMTQFFDYYPVPGRYNGCTEKRPW